MSDISRCAGVPNEKIDSKESKYCETCGERGGGGGSTDDDTCGVG